VTEPTSQTETPATPEKPEPVAEKTTAPTEKTFTQAELDRIVGERLDRQKGQLTSQYADYDDLKTASEQLREIKDAQKSEQEKANDKIAELNQRLADQAAEVEKANLAALKSEVARVKGVPANRLHGKTQEELEADADAYLTELAGREQNAPKRNPPKTPAANLKSGASSSDNNNGLSGKAQAAQMLRQLQRGA
jgi:hypothetical protein